MKRAQLSADAGGATGPGPCPEAEAEAGARPGPGPSDIDQGPDSDSDRRHDFDLSAAAYEEEVDRSISFTGRSASFFAKRKVDLLERLLRAYGRDFARATVLDVGCGTGTTDRHLVDHVEALHGVDPSEKMVAMARRNVPLATFESYDGKTIPYADGSFDLVIAICVMHHVPVDEQLALVRELRRVTRPGGVIAILEHNPANPLTRRAVSDCELDEGVELLRAKDVRRLLVDAGAGDIRTDYFLFTPIGGRLGAGVDRWLRRLPLGGQHAVLARAV
jgi:SAM-dependent methyltransferase